MPVCPIIQEEIENEECWQVCREAEKEGKANHTAVAKKYKRIVCWKAICKICKHHNRK